MKLTSRIAAFSQLGAFLRSFANEKTDQHDDLVAELEQAIVNSVAYNGWFTRKDILYALVQTGMMLTVKNIKNWIEPYKERIESRKQPKTIGVVTAGNIPAVGFHDLLCVLISGNKLLAKLSDSDRFLLPFFYKLLCSIDAEFNGLIAFTDGRLKDFDAVIATGSNNTSRYFDYYFAPYPHIIRKNRNGIAVIDSNEKKQELEGLCEDMFRYFGLGCRSVSKLFIPSGYNFDGLTKAANSWDELKTHHKYASNYTYYKALYQMSAKIFMDNGLFLLKKDEAFGSPVSVIFYEEYDDINVLNARLKNNRDKIQCIVSSNPAIDHTIPFGTCQKPRLADYSDGIDTMEFLIEM